MKEGPDIARIAALIGDPARANMLSALMSGKALTASELAAEANVTRQTASAHLSKLSDSQLLLPRKQGRHRYYAIADERVAEVITGLMGLAETAGHTRTRTGPRDAALRKARSCYNHLAGHMGTRLFDGLFKKGYILREPDGVRLSEEGRTFVADFGIDLGTLAKTSSPLCGECLDWSERRSHLSGKLGRAFLRRFEDLGWATRDPQSRAILFSVEGERAFEALLV